MQTTSQDYLIPRLNGAGSPQRDDPTNFVFRDQCETTGFVKWIADATTDQLLGAAAVGSHATELVATAATAIRAELTATQLGRTIHAHPTFSEAWMEAAHSLHGEAIHGPAKRKK